MAVIAGISQARVNPEVLGSRYGLKVSGIDTRLCEAGVVQDLSGRNGTNQFLVGNYVDTS